MATREPFMDVLRRGLRWGGFAGLGVYAFAILTGNKSLYTGAAPTIEDDSLEHLSYAQLRRVYEDEIKQAALRDERGTAEIIDRSVTGSQKGSRSPETPKGYKPKSRCIIRKTGQEAILYERDQEEEQVEHLQTELAKVVETCGEIAKSLRLSSAAEEAARLKEHIDRLHAYNEVKDLAQALIGRLAVMEGCTTRELYPRFDLNLED